MSIKFGIPTTMETIEDVFPGRAVLTLNKLENENSKRTFTLSKTAAEQFGIVPGITEVAFSFDGGSFLGVIPSEQDGIPSTERYQVNKKLNFVSKKAYSYICGKYGLVDNLEYHIEFTTITDMHGFRVGQLDDKLMGLPEPENVAVNVEENTDVNNDDPIL